MGQPHITARLSLRLRGRSIARAKTRKKTRLGIHQGRVRISSLPLCSLSFSHYQCFTFASKCYFFLVTGTFAPHNTDGNIPRLFLLPSCSVHTQTKNRNGSQYQLKNFKPLRTPSKPRIANHTRETIRSTVTPHTSKAMLATIRHLGQVLSKVTRAAILCRTHGCRAERAVSSLVPDIRIEEDDCRTRSQREPTATVQLPWTLLTILPIYRVTPVLACY
jgi:hypothetical protein